MHAHYDRHTEIALISIAPFKWVHNTGKSHLFTVFLLHIFKMFICSWQKRMFCKRKPSCVKSKRNHSVWLTSNICEPFKKSMKHLNVSNINRIAKVTSRKTLQISAKWVSLDIVYIITCDWKMKWISIDSIINREKMSI